MKRTKSESSMSVLAKLMTRPPFLPTPSALYGTRTS